MLWKIVILKLIGILGCAGNGFDNIELVENVKSSNIQKYKIFHVYVASLKQFKAFGKSRLELVKNNEIKSIFLNKIPI